jgi:hypothetical protein
MDALNERGQQGRRSVVQNDKISRISGRLSARQATLTALVALVLGCAREGTSDTSDTSGALSRAFCEQLQACGLANFEQIEDCTGESELFCDHPDLDIPIAGAAKCVRALRAQSCAEFESSSEPPAACERPFAQMEGVQGAADLGESCTLDTGCVGELYCTAKPGSCGVCQPLPGAGEACVDGDCRTGHFCSEEDLCEPEKSNGASCVDDSECQTETCSAGKCAAPAVLSEGESCGGFDRCESDTLCAAGRCRARASRGEPCVAGQCYLGLVCEDGKCVQVAGCGMAQEGDRCNFDDQCGQGLGCELTEQRCRPAEKRLELGAACKGDLSCLSGLCFAGACTDPARACAESGR